MTTGALLYTVDADPESFRQLRITVGTMTLYGTGKFAALRQDVDEWFYDTTGEYASAMTDEEFAQVPVETRAARTALMGWAKAVAATVKVEERTDPAGEFEQVAGLPFQWDTIEGVTHPETGMSAQAIITWENLAIEHNPGYWHGYSGDAKKKAGFAVRSGLTTNSDASPETKSEASA